MSTIARTSTLGACAAAIAAGAAFLFPGSASAAPGDPDGSPMLNTTCTVEQIESAVQHEAPKFWERLNADPEKLQKATEHLQGFLDKSPEERKEAMEGMKAHAQEWAKENPDKAKKAKAHHEKMRTTMHQVFATCDQY